jgi:hypothetical protein
MPLGAFQPPAPAPAPISDQIARATVDRATVSLLEPCYVQIAEVSL